MMMTTTELIILYPLSSYTSNWLFVRSHIKSRGYIKPDTGIGKTAIQKVDSQNAWNPRLEKDFRISQT
jgi:hypothetical protein